jgi:glutamate formiminotransferase/formiminotetrahydrofolate cyclodeaminase
LVGLTPQGALIDAAQWYLQLDDLEPDQLLESRLVGAAESKSFLDRLAAGTPTPGGGSAAAHAGAMGAALVAMVGQLTIGKKKYAEVEADAQRLVEQAEGLRRRLTAAVEQDAQAFEAVMDALRLPKDNADARAQALQLATLRAGEVPLAVARDSAQVMALAAEMARIGNSNAITDAGAAASLAHAALHAAGLNVRINAASLDDRTVADRWLQEIAELESAAAEPLASVQQSLAERAGLHN